MSSERRDEVPRGSNATLGDRSPIVQGNQNTLAGGAARVSVRFHGVSFALGIVTGIISSLIAAGLIRLVAGG